MTGSQSEYNFVTYTEVFCHLAVTSSFDDETKALFWIGANYHPVDLPDTFGLNWMDAIIRCLESVLSVQSAPRPADGEVTLAETCQSKPEEKRAVLTPR